MQFKKWVIKNKYKTILGSIFFATLITIPTIIGTIQANQIKNKNENNKYIYEPGDVRFDENGKLIIPEVIDKDNPNGNYKYKITNTLNTTISGDFVGTPEFKKEVQFYNKKNLQTIKTMLKDSLNTQVVVDYKVKLAIDNIIPQNSVTIDQNLTLDKFIDIIAYDASELYKDSSLSITDVRNYCALSGVNLDKEYNAMMTQNSSNIMIYGGGGHRPPANNPPPKPDFGDINPQTMSWDEQKKILDQNIKYLEIFAITNTVVLSVLTTLSVTFSILSVLTGGASLSSLVWLIPEIVFSSLVIASSWEEYHATKELRETIFTDIFNEVIYKSGLATSFGELAHTAILHTLDTLNIKGFQKPLLVLTKKIDILSRKVKFLSSSKISKISTIISFASIAYSIVMKQLHDNLIKDTWIVEYLNKYRG